MMKTYSAKPSHIQRKWHLLDASQVPLGRLGTEAAKLLIGKHKPIFSPNIDCGDYVVIINSDKLKVTGNKMKDKAYYRHSGYPGNLKEKSLEQMIEKDSTKVIELSVKRMLPDNKLRRERAKRLKIYKDSTHEHSAQKPEQVKLSSKG